MKISKHTVPSVTYTLIVAGEVIEVADQTQPLVYLHGADGMIIGFESALEGLTVGDKFDFKVAPEQGYGECHPDMMVSLPKENFCIDGVFAEEMVFEGAVIPMQDQNGHPMRGTVMQVNEEAVKIDFNHPLAGKELHFAGEVLTVRMAEKEEIAHGHVHGEGGHHH